MVHALHETWRVTRSHVFDIRPLAVAPLVYVRDRQGGDTLCGALTWCDDSGQHHVQADTAWARVIAAEKFAVIQQAQFDWYDTFTTADELVTQVHDQWVTWTIEEDLALRLLRTLAQAGRDAVPYIRQPSGVRLLQKC